MAQESKSQLMRFERAKSTYCSGIEKGSLSIRRMLRPHSRLLRGARRAPLKVKDMGVDLQKKRKLCRNNLGFAIGFLVTFSLIALCGVVHVNQLRDGVKAWETVGTQAQLPLERAASGGDVGTVLERLGSQQHAAGSRGTSPVGYAGRKGCFSCADGRARQADVEGYLQNVRDFKNWT
ncbi:hypothetical protein [Paraburkholderia sp. BCC1884]|uniref:hypothetical protein n=1 Tax=Paraburkholderia sp. BCC1884 TaxID=2562668 RepID=UPI001183CF55|nr:hypothetical protein [Paraburkholderia sp. BCC1884]